MTDESRTKAPSAGAYKGERQRVAERWHGPNPSKRAVAAAWGDRTGATGTGEPEFKPELKPERAAEPAASKSGMSIPVKGMGGVTGWGTGNLLGTTNEAKAAYAAGKRLMGVSRFVKKTTTPDAEVRETALRELGEISVELALIAVLAKSQERYEAAVKALKVRGAIQELRLRAAGGIYERDGRIGDGGYMTQDAWRSVTAREYPALPPGQSVEDAEYDD